MFFFFIILANQSIVRSCTPGFYFDARDQQCVDVSEVRCLPKCPATGLSSFCYDRTCTKYVLCFAGEPVVRECVDGLQYNAETDRCDYPQYVDCVDNLCVRQNNPNNIVFIASKSVCDKYYICVDGQPTNQTCSSGLQFNKETNNCDFPSRSKCEVSVYNESNPSITVNDSTYNSFLRSQHCNATFSPTPECHHAALTSLAPRRVPTSSPTRAARKPTTSA